MGEQTGGVAYTKNQKWMGANQHPPMEPAHSMGFTWGFMFEGVSSIGLLMGVVDSLGPIFGERSQVPVLRWVEHCISNPPFADILISSSGIAA
jgi:hypothetical protein